MGFAFVAFFFNFFMRNCNFIFIDERFFKAFCVIYFWCFSHFAIISYVMYILRVGISDNVQTITSAVCRLQDLYADCEALSIQATKPCLSEALSIQTSKRCLYELRSFVYRKRFLYKLWNVVSTNYKALSTQTTKCCLCRLNFVLNRAETSNLPSSTKFQSIGKCIGRHFCT